MKSSLSLFVCQQCGNEFSKWSGRCAACGEWNTLVETKLSTRKSKIQSSKSKKRREPASQPVALSEISGAREKERLSTGMDEVDRVLGGGLVPGGVVLLAGEPGVGKSTLLLQIVQNAAAGLVPAQKKATTRVATTGSSSVLYVSAEESVSQLAGRARRVVTQRAGAGSKENDGAQSPSKLGQYKHAEPLQILAETNLENIITQIEKIRPSLVIVDSIQAIETEAFSSGSGSISQVRECAGQLTNLAKEIDTALFIVGHITKEGAIAGPKVLEHIVDTVLYFEGERYRDLRLLRSTKNRFGPVDEVGVFHMDDNGLQEVSNPSELFLGQTGRCEINKHENKRNKTRNQAKSGSCVVAAMEGTRPVLVEIEALVVGSSLAVPRRVGRGIDYQRLLMLCAICQKQLRLNLFKTDVYVNVSGGLKINEPAADLGICLAIYSSVKNKPLKSDSAALGEVGLLGEIRPIAQLEKRIKEAKRLGFKTIISSQNASSLIEAVKQAVIP